MHDNLDNPSNNSNEIEQIETAGQTLLDQGDFDGLAQWLEDLSADLVEGRPRLRYLHARWLAHAGQLSDAIIELEQACQHAVADEEWLLAIDGYLWLARLHQRQEAIILARDYLSTAELLAQKHPPSDAVDKARLALTIGRLYPDLGDNRQAVAQCGTALHHFEEAGDASGQVEALWLLAVAHSYLVNLHAAQAYIKRALCLNQAHDLGEVQRLYLLNVQAHIALYAGQTDDGLAVLDEAAPLLVRHPLRKPALYLATAEGALRCQAGDLDGSLAAYARAEDIMQEREDVGFRPWLTMGQSWTQLLAGEQPAEVRRALLAVIDPQSPTTWRSAQTCLAVLDVLEERWRDALARLEEVLPQFEAAGELMSAFASRIYLAYVHLQVGERPACHAMIEAGLGWAERVACDGFPYFWYPAIVAEVCAEALQAGIYPQQAEMMFIRRLGGDAGVSALLSLLDDPVPEVRTRATSILAAMGGDVVLKMLDGVSQPAVREVLLDHLRAGRLVMSRLEALEEKLRTARQYAQPSWTRVAVFGFYVTGQFTRRQIAERLHVSSSTVKNHITVIRRAFGVTGRGTADLRQQAMNEGFVARNQGHFR